jgi:hypothetical protein
VAELNKLVNADMSAAYQQVAKKPWTRKLKGVSGPVGGGDARKP